ncbi:hypothetical protein ['Camptotheca acuminata' phytoplasma]|uniref:hypothetical protein n=1 Tax='Camptotheca acuminata' phytoplasma TaxID=3239192 RepID=UPI003519E49F
MSEEKKLQDLQTLILNLNAEYMRDRKKYNDAQQRYKAKFQKFFSMQSLGCNLTTPKMKEKRHLLIEEIIISYYRYKERYMYYRGACKQLTDNYGLYFNYETKQFTNQKPISKKTKQQVIEE